MTRLAFVSLSYFFVLLIWLFYHNVFCKENVRRFYKHLIFLISLYTQILQKSILRHNYCPCIYNKFCLHFLSTHWYDQVETETFWKYRLLPRRSPQTILRDPPDSLELSTTLFYFLDQASSWSDGRGSKPPIKIPKHGGHKRRELTVWRNVHILLCSIFICFALFISSKK